MSPVVVRGSAISGIMGVHGNREDVLKLEQTDYQRVTQALGDFARFDATNAAFSAHYLTLISERTGRDVSESIVEVVRLAQTGVLNNAEARHYIKDALTNPLGVEREIQEALTVKEALYQLANIKVGTIEAPSAHMSIQDLSDHRMAMHAPRLIPNVGLWETIRMLEERSPVSILTINYPAWTKE